MRKERKHYRAEEKVAILRRHLLDKIPVSDLCEEYGLQPTVFYRWQKEFFENGAAAFESKQRPAIQVQEKQKRIEFLEKKVQTKDEVLAELMAEHVALKNAIFNRVVPVSSPAVAEMTKLLENIYRCVNIALVNELKLLCLRMGIDIFEVIQAAATKPFGFQPFYPGPGLGGHCIPIDPFYLSWKAKEFDFHTRFIELAGEVNLHMPYHVVSSVAKAMNERRQTLNGSKVLVLGLAYKKDIDDLRESPSLTVIELLQNEGAEVSYNDPFFPTVGRGRKYDLNMTSTPLSEIEKFDCVLIVTDHSTYDYRDIVQRAKLVIDTRNATNGVVADNLVRC